MSGKYRNVPQSPRYCGLFCLHRSAMFYLLLAINRVRPAGESEAQAKTRREGRYFTLAEARSERERCRGLVKQGIHPSHQQRTETLRRSLESASTFEAVAEVWIEEGRKSWSENYLRQIKQRFAGDVYPYFAAVASMVALGSVIGRKLGIRLKQRDDWTEYANVWGGIIGPPSALKSPAMREAMRPFKGLQAEADRPYAAAKQQHDGEMRAWKAAKPADRDDPPAAPVARCYWTSDATGAKLGELLAENPNGLLVERDELSSLLVSLEDESNADAQGLYLSGWSGNEGYRFDRISRGTVSLPKFALSVLGGIQPG